MRTTQRILVAGGAVAATALCAAIVMALTVDADGARAPSAGVPALRRLQDVGGPTPPPTPKPVPHTDAPTPVFTDCGSVKGSHKAGLGFVACLISIVFFGSNYVPVKKYETGDGMFFQWVMAVAIWTVGLIVAGAKGFPPMQPAAMVGGALWATGNCFSVPVIKMIGLSLGLLLWGGTNMVFGWAAGQFGLFGLRSQASSVNIPALNYVGVVIAVLSLVMYMFVESSTGDEDGGDGGTAGTGLHEALLSGSGAGANGSGGGIPEDGVYLGAPDDDEMARMAGRLKAHAAQQDYLSITAPSPRLVGSEYAVTQRGELLSPAAAGAAGPNGNGANAAGARAANDTSARAANKSPLDALSARQKKVAGIAGAVLSGIFYGSNFDPPQYLMDHATSLHDMIVHRRNGETETFSRCDGLNYVFSHFCGIFLASTFWFLVYCAAMKNRPRVYPRAILPGFVSGLMWAVAQTSWFVANENLGFVVSFPLISTGPGLVASLWGVFLYKEIRGRKNLMVLSGAFVMTIVAVLCIALSKELPKPK